MPKPLFLWDIDDVLNDLVFCCCQNQAQRLKPGIHFEEIHSNPPLEEFGCSLEEYMALLDECRREHLYSRPPAKEVLEFFNEYGHLFHSMTLSSAPMDLAPRSAEWVLRHFGKWIQGTLFVPSPRKHIPPGSVLFASKAEAVVKLNGILIDDMPINVESVRKAGGRALYFPAPWNENAAMKKENFLKSLLEFCKE